ncbi:hypothetical protein EG329_013715 [Mollisiaceae sp. DMI_Dod_QoI]|nr:hypothetical protein EG329_013715 [Helotiales sp. DMI_Dod_QoI]
MADRRRGRRDEDMDDVYNNPLRFTRPVLRPASCDVRASLGEQVIAVAVAVSQSQARADDILGDLVSGALFWASCAWSNLERHGGNTATHVSDRPGSSDWWDSAAALLPYGRHSQETRRCCRRAGGAQGCGSLEDDEKDETAALDFLELGIFRWKRHYTLLTQRGEICGALDASQRRLYNTQALTNPSTPLILYLPPTGSHLREQHPQIPSYLFQPSISLARINYRWNIPKPSPTNTPGSSPSPKLLSSDPSYSNHPFPTPLHDILHAYNYLVDTVLPRYSPLKPSPPVTPTRTPYSAPPAFSRLKIIQRPIILYGSFLGGTLATSIALTESRKSLSHPVKIAGLVVKNGIFDFSPLALTQPPSTPVEDGEVHDIEAEREELGLNSQTEAGNGPWNQGWDNQLLDPLKKKLFANPGSTFDSFASPVMFFRTSGFHVPKHWPGEENSSNSTSPLEGNIWLDGFEGYDQHGEPILPLPIPSSPKPRSTSSSPSTSTSLLNENENENESENENSPPHPKTSDLNLTPPPKKAHLKFPPQNTDLVIPPTLFLYTTPPSSPSSTPPKRHAKTKNKTLTQHPALALNLNELSPEVQTSEMRELMTRSIILHEFRDRGWDEGDPREIAESRVKLSKIIDGKVVSFEEEEEEQEEGEGKMVSEWIRDILPQT